MKSWGEVSTATEDVGRSRRRSSGESPRALDQQVIAVDCKPISFVIWLFAQLFSTVMPWPQNSGNTMGLTLLVPPPTFYHNKIRRLARSYLPHLFFSVQWWLPLPNKTINTSAASSVYPLTIGCDDVVKEYKKPRGVRKAWFRRNRGRSRRFLWGKSPCTRTASVASRLETHFIRDLVVRTII